jgi:two-component system response regulator GlrR
MQIAFASLCEDPSLQARLQQVRACASASGLAWVAAGAGARPALVADALVLAAPRRELPACCDSIARWRTACPDTPVLVFTDVLDGQAIEALMRSGAHDVASLQACDEELLLRIRRAVGPWPARPAAEPSGGAPTPGPDLGELPLCARLIGRSTAFARLLTQLQRMARCDSGVLLLGETGTGKEVCAQAIHYSSARAKGPWVAINCAAIPAELVEDELFGHVRGAYTHASANRSGLVHEAEGGTLLLDEIDALPLASQAKLLRFLQEKEFRPVGSSRLQHADVRVIAASNRDLEQAVAHGTFRQDLFFRLNVLTLRLPPLRERAHDIDELARAFFDEFRTEAAQPLLGISPAALQKLRSHAWPGNVRELRNTVQRAVLLAQGDTVQAVDIELCGQPPESGDGPTEADALVGSFRAAKARVVEAFERHYLEQLLQQCEGNISQAARVASKNRRAFFELLRRHDIKADAFR